MLRSNNETKLVELRDVECEIKKFALDRAASSIFRSQCNYADMGEKCSKYFMSLEKKRYFEKNMKCIITEEGAVISDQDQILKEQMKFYQNLYAQDTTVQFKLKPENGERTLSDTEQQLCEQPFSKDEFFDALMTMKPNKVPGLDGFTIEFYRKFWKIISSNLIKMYQHSFELGILPESVRQGLISLLPKKNKDTRFVKNMRPLTLLNNDYKILAKALDNRLREVLPLLIAPDQTGFIKGRKIAHNIRKSLDIIDFAKDNSIPMLILSIDMEKCFDRLEHRAIFASLRYFNFGENFIKWVSLFYEDFKICTQNFGFCSPLWKKGRGCNQGCPLSPGLYLLTAEIMANKLRKNPKIKGVHVGSVEHLISQFADDTDLYLSYDQGTLNATFDVLTGIETNTGLCVSYEKTTLYRIGS